MKYLCIVVVCVLVGIGAPVLAKDVCVQDTGTFMIFKKVKKLKAGGAIALHGLFIQGTSAFPFDGSAMMKSDGTTVLVGAFVHSMSLANNFTLEWVTDTTFAGSASYDNDGDYFPNASFNFVTVDCTTVTVP
jgi:hypothetical protein